MHKALFFFFVCTFFSVISFAAKITGTVSDATDGKPLPGVLVVLKESNKVTETDSIGNFEFIEIESGTYEIVCSFVTYKEVLQTVSVINNKDVVLNIKLKPEVSTQLKDVTVTTNRITNTEKAVMMEIRKSNLVVSGISAAQISKTADRNAADVIRRMPGVSIFDDKFLVVRGLHDRYNTVWLNDAGAPSSEADKKSFSFDLIPSGVIDRMLLFKTPAPELPGDFAGGMVKIYTSSLPERNQLEVGLQTSYRDNTTGKPFYYNAPSKTDWLGYDDGKRSLPAEVGPNKISRNDSNNSAVTKAFGKNSWVLKQKNASPDIRFNLKAGNVFKLGNWKLGNTFALSYSNLNKGYPYERRSSDSAALPDYYTMDSTYTNDVNATVMDNLVAMKGNLKIEFRNLYNQTGSATAMLRRNLIDSVPNEKSYLMQYESRAVYTSQLSGGYKTINGKTNINLTLGYTDLFKNVPDLRRIRYVKQPGDNDSAFTAGVASGNVDPVNGGGRYFAQLFEKIYSANLQATQKLRIGNYDFSINAGAFYEYKSRSFNQRLFGYTLKRTPRNVPSNSALLRLPIDEIFNDQNVGDTYKFRIDESTDLSDKYSATNRMIAPYAALNLPFKDKFNAYGGVRFEHNTQTVQGYVGADSINPKVVTKFFLPSINLSYDIQERMKLRLAYGKTLNRPEFREWAPLFFYDMIERWGVYGSLHEGSTHDTLKVCQINNFDFRWEWYPSNDEMIQAGVFYKTFKDPIQFYILEEGSDSRKMTYINTQKAYSAGIEVDFRKSFSFADKWLNTRFMKDLMLVGNVTLLKSEMTIGDTFNTKKTTPMQGQSPYMVNAGLFYQNANWGIQASALYNVYGPRIIALGKNRLADYAELPFHSLDALVSKTFYKHYTLSFGMQNILNATYKRIQDQVPDGKYKYDRSGNDDTIFRIYSPGRYYTVGVKVKI